MARSLAKVTKKITKKKGTVTSLHEHSRDSQKLRRACARAEKLNRVSVARAKANEPYLERIAFFQQVARTITSAAAPDETIELSTIKSLIESYITRHAPELSALQSSRRPNRPSSAREDLLKQRISQEEREYEAGFWIPDIQNQETLSLLGEWNGEWTSLARLKFVRMTRGGMLKESRFPPKGES